MRTHRIRFTGGLAALAVAAAVVAAPPAGAGTAAVPATATVPLLGTPCLEAAPPPPGSPPGTPSGPPVPLECATLPVPVDHGRPDGPQLPLAVYRLAGPPAPDHRGSLLMNPGGPGGTGKDFLAAVAGAMPAPLVASFDLVTFDPRGVGASAGLTCGTGESFVPAPGAPDPVAAQIDFVRRLGAECAAEDAALLPELGTLNVARDVERLRRALGEDTLDYVGFSYGTLLGATYASLFPDRVGRFVLDGGIDPNLSYRSLIIDQVASFEEVLGQFFAACDREPTCPFGEGGTEANFDALVARARDEGLPVAAPGLPPVDAGQLIDATVGALYAGYRVFPAAAQALAEAAAGDATTVAQVAAALASSPLGLYWAVVCADSDALYDRPEVNFALWALRDRAPRLAPAVLEILGCLGFPPATEPLGRFDLGGSGVAPALVIGTTHDPATPYAWSQALAETWGDATVLTFEGAGHTAAFGGFGCVDEAVVAFLLLGQRPPAGTTCRPRVLGVELQAGAGGAVVTAVQPDGPAAGVLQPGDVIVAVAGGPLDPATLRSLIDRGEPFTVTVVRAGATVDVELAGGPPPYWAP
jgi:pimeloyl-ACP methyl ester carboxylesterase